MNPNYILVGNSLGTNIIVEALKFGIISKGIVFGGPCVIGGKYTLESIVMPGADTSAVFLDDALDERVRKYASETSISKDEDDLNCFLKDYYLVKKPFRSSFSKTLADGTYSDEINLLHRSAITIALIFGAKDKIINPGYLDNAPFKIWNNQVYKIPNASHLVHIDQSLEFNRILADYASEMFK